MGQARATCINCILKLAGNNVRAPNGRSNGIGCIAQRSADVLREEAIQFGEDVRNILLHASEETRADLVNSIEQARKCRAQSSGDDVDGRRRQDDLSGILRGDADRRSRYAHDETCAE
jgi:hypothetical protein